MWGAVGYCFVLRYLTSFVNKCHRGEEGYFDLEDIVMTFAGFISGTEKTNFCIADPLIYVIHYANEVHIYYTRASFQVFPEQTQGEDRCVVVQGLVGLVSSDHICDFGLEIY